MAGGLAAGTLVGRRDEQRRLDGLLRRVAGGGSAAVLVEGEAGIGKSTLLDVLAAGATARGLTILRGRGDDLERDRPFRAVAEALGADRRADATPALDEDASHRAVDGFVAKLEAAALAGPVVLALDDVQWADLGTLRVVRTAARSLADLPLGIALAHRPTPREPALAATLDDLARAGAETIALDALDGAAVAELAGHVLEARCSARLVGELARTGGNPLYVLELLASLRSDGLVTIEDGEADLGGAAELPPGLRHTIVRRVSVLPPGTIELLRAASILGGTFDPAHLAAVLDRPVGALLTDLQPALDAGVLADDGVGGRLAFRHDLIRAAVYEDVPSAVRAVLHLDAARALDRAGASAGDLLAHLDNARLDEAAGFDADTADLLHRVAMAVRHTAPAPAIRLFERALELVDDPARRDELLAGLAVPLASVGRTAEAEQVAREVLGRPHDPALGASLRDALHLALLRSGRTADDVVELEQIAARTDLDDAERLERATDLAHALVVSGEIERGGAMVEANLPVARAAGDDRNVVRNLLVAVPVALCRGEVASAIAAGEEAMALDRRLARPITANMMHGLALIDADRMDEAGQVLAEGRRRELDEGEPTAATIYFWALAGLHYLTGRWDDAVTEIESGLAFVAEGVGASIGVLFPRGLAARIHLHRGTTAEAEAEVAAGQARLLERGPESGVDFLAWAQALVLADQGNQAGGAAVLHGIWSLLGEARYFMGWRLFGPDLARMAAATGDVDTAAAMAAGAAIGADRAGGVPSAEAAALRCHAFAAGDPAAAVKAAELLADGPRRVEAALAAEDAGRALADAGDRSAGVRHLQEALLRWEALGGSADGARVEADLRRLGARRSGRKPRRPATGWASLTPTERSVVELVSEGRTNPEVAEVLFVSRRTVETHLAHVFSKLGLRSRVELAAAWTRHTG